MIGVGIVGDSVEVPQFVCAPNWLVGFQFGFAPNWVVGWWFGVVPNLVVCSQFGVAPNWLLCSKLGLAPIKLLGCGSWLMGECGRWSCGWGLGWCKGDGSIPNLDSWGRCVCGECVDCWCTEIRYTCG